MPKLKNCLTQHIVNMDALSLMAIEHPTVDSCSPRHRNHALVKKILVVSGTYAAYSTVLPLLPIPAIFQGRVAEIALLILTTSLFMLLQLFMDLQFAYADLSVRAALSGVGISGLIWGGAYFALERPHFVQLMHVLQMAPNEWYIPNYILHQAMMMCLTLVCIFGGCMLSHIVRERNILLPVALAAIPIDYLGAMTKFGFTSNVVKSNPALLYAVTVPVPVARGLLVHGIQPAAIVGPGDVLFMTFFLCAVNRLRMNTVKTYWYVYLGVAVSMLCVVLLPNFNIAALIPIGIAVIIANYKYLTLKRSEVFATLYAVGFVLVLVLCFYLYTNHYVFGRK